MNRRPEPVWFSSSEWRLEGLLTRLPGGERGAVICHPHPLYGGNMDHLVVRALEKGLQQAGLATLRFNFRGVGKSTGAYSGGDGEADDLRAAVAYLRKAAGVQRVAVAGYSFGAAIVLRLAPVLPEVDRMVVVAPPLSLLEPGDLSTWHKPKLVIAGSCDAYCDLEALDRWFVGIADPKRRLILSGADHFLYGEEPAIVTATAEFAAGATCKGRQSHSPAN